MDGRPTGARSICSMRLLESGTTSRKLTFIMHPNEYPNRAIAIMASNPMTGECFATFIGRPPNGDVAHMMNRGALVARATPEQAKEAFAEAHDSRRIVAFGPIIGTYLDQDIREWYQTADGRRHDYTGVCGERPRFEMLKQGESVLAPGVVYLNRDR